MDLLIKKTVAEIDRRIRRAFSGSAMQYDQLTSLHREIGRDLLKKMRTVEPCEKILEIGMGTGWLTGKICFYFPEAKVVGIDFADGMIAQAAQKQDQGFQVVQADCTALPFREESFDCIASNLAFQWVDDLEKSFRFCYQALKDGGTLCLTLFGYHSLSELFSCLNQSLGETPSIRRLPTLEAIHQALESAGFQNPHLDYERIKIRFPDMLNLIKWTKEIGANRLQKNFFVGRDLLSKAGSLYDEQFRDRFGIYATFEVIWAVARKT